MIGIRNGEVVYIPSDKATGHKATIEQSDIDLVKILSI
jgi:hypothetical protein